MNRRSYWRGLRFRWRGVRNYYICRLVGHRMVAPDGQWHWRTCDRCCWAPTETPEPRSPVAAYGRGWLSLVPFVFPRRARGHMSIEQVLVLVILVLLIVWIVTRLDVAAAALVPFVELGRGWCRNC